MNIVIADGATDEMAEGVKGEVREEVKEEVKEAEQSKASGKGKSGKEID